MLGGGGGVGYLNDEDCTGLLDGFGAAYLVGRRLFVEFGVG